MAFARTHGGQALIVAVPRLMGAAIDDRLTFAADAWSGTGIVLAARLRDRTWRSVLGSASVIRPSTLTCDDLFETMPVAALLSD